MNPRPNRSANAIRYFAFVVLLFGCMTALTGCLSTKYKTAPKDTPPAIVLNLATVQAPIAAAVNTVIVFKGPGSWKREAYWDEYVVSIVNQGPARLTVDSAILVDALGARQSCGRAPWELEKLSRENLKKYEHYGRRVMIGTGLTVGWAISGGVAGAAAWAGEAALATTAGAVFLVMPVWAIGSGVRYFVAKNSITEEFNRRRIILPVELKPGETRQGSFFFPVSPGPQRLELNCRSDAAAQVVTLDLTPLAGLHFLKELAQSAPVPAANP